jgi:hypothetical protein
MTIRKDFTWTRFWRWLVLWDWADVISEKWKITRTLECECECWTRKTVRHYNLVNWKSISCWCYHWEVSREIIKELHRTQKLEWNPNWKWGIAYHNQKATSEIRRSYPYKEWSNLVKIKDWFKCRKCWSWEALHSHHIINFTNEETRYDVNNWITFCRDCHEWFHKKFWYRNNNETQIMEYLGYLGD